MEGWGDGPLGCDGMGWDGFELRYYIGIVRGSLLRMGKFQLVTALPETISMGMIEFVFCLAKQEMRNASTSTSVSTTTTTTTSPFPIHPQQGE